VSTGVIFHALLEKSNFESGVVTYCIVPHV
jgi:hypothetical protein